MRVRRLGLPGVLLLETPIHRDRRGELREFWHEQHYADVGITDVFRQDLLSASVRGVVRGLHLQSPNSQAKLIGVPFGEVHDVAVDVRAGSPTFGQWCAATLSAGNGHQIYIPAGFAHGYVVRSERAVVAYKCSAVYDPPSDLGIRWDDPDIGIDWGITDPILSDKDAASPRLADVPQARLPRY